MLDDAAPPTAPSREETLLRLTAGRFDLLVIGGGITGCGVARDAVLRGMRVALVEQGDLASGTSSRSSRLIHGGVRYLEQGALRLVFEASAERRRLLRLAPHLVRPLAFTWPVYRGARVPLWKLRAGLALYDLLALFRNVGRHRRLHVADVSAQEPALHADSLVGGATYWDAATDDARLTLATGLDAARAGAVIATYTEVTDFVHEGARISGAVVRNTFTGESVTVHARAIVNAAGPWSDAIRALEGERRSVSAVRGTKGVHLSVPRQRIGNRGALTLITPSDGRVFFVIPDGAFAIIGTTDTDTAESPGDVRATRGDVGYLLDAANAFFPQARLSADDVISAWAGVRPLASAAGNRAGAPSSASREHAIVVSHGGVVTVTGGKLTTYRAMAAEVVNLVQRMLDRRVTPTPTVTRVLPGGTLGDRAAAVAAARDATQDEAVANRLVDAHGADWRSVWMECAHSPEQQSRLVPELPYLGGELTWSARHELAETIGDLLIRRTRLAFETRDHGMKVAERAADLVAPVFGWDRQRVELELVRYRQEVDRIFTIDP